MNATSWSGDYGENLRNGALVFKKLSLSVTMCTMFNLQLQQKIINQHTLELLYVDRDIKLGVKDKLVMECEAMKGKLSR